MGKVVQTSWHWVYQRTLGSQGSWNSYEDYLTAPTFVGYNNSDGSSSDYAWLPGHWLSEQEPPGEGSMFYQDSFGVQVFGGDFDPQAPMKRLPEYLYEPEITPLRTLLQASQEPAKKTAECPKGKCETSVSTDMATCCPDGRPYCGPPEHFQTVCGTQPKPPTPPGNPPKVPPHPPTEWDCYICMGLCLGFQDRDFFKCWKRCADQGQCPPIPGTGRGNIDIGIIPGVGVGVRYEWRF